MSLGLTALELARIQFAFTVSFHIIFPATSIGLACFLALLEWKWLRTQNPVYSRLRHGGGFRRGHGLSVRHQLE